MGCEEAPVVEPVDPLQHGVLDVVEVLPWSALSDELGLIEPTSRSNHRWETRLLPQDRTERQYRQGNRALHGR